MPRFDFNQFKKQIKKDNWTFRLKKSELKNLYGLLQNGVGLNANSIAFEMNKVPEAKWNKYRKTRTYLLSSFPGLESALAQGRIRGGASPDGYIAGKWYKRRDKDRRWHEILLQSKDNSCGPACVLIIKQLLNPIAKSQLREPQIRGLIAQAEANTLHTGVSSLSTATLSLHNWQHVGSTNPALMTILKGRPFPVSMVRYASSSKATLFAQLNACSVKKPAIVGWAWDSGGGHWTVCIGPTKNEEELIILDPYNGIQYVQNDIDHFTRYQSFGTLEYNYRPLSPVLTN